MSLVVRLFRMNKKQTNVKIWPWVEIRCNKLLVMWYFKGLIFFFTGSL